MLDVFWLVVGKFIFVFHNLVEMCKSIFYLLSIYDYHNYLLFCGSEIYIIAFA